ncbi:MAG: glutamate--tRNA ligase [Gammaproteobacteria bacterium]|nr:glutamate--tRNA ligase [Gammaproteobacteria bacterium]NNC97784.1 glutamate--tRNA ligase [Gammaproteobacteria bacterium]
MTVRTRFAPSPTGFLHIGGVRTALFAWLYAKKHNGVFVLRIEDTDRERSTEASVQAILDGMQWLGLNADEGPFYQTDNFPQYKKVIQQLLDQGDAYYCYCSKVRIDNLREQQRANKQKPRYDGHCRQLSEPVAGVDPVVRFKNPVEGDTTFLDLVKGEISVANAELDDLIIARSDGTPTYNLTVVVDDRDMNITHVIRGDDHVNNTPRQINIYKALDAAVPEFAHLPMILGADGSRLSKRHGAVNVMAYKEAGYLPEALLNYLVRLGWSHGDKELFSREEMIELFGLDDVNRAPASFDPEKLNWINQQYLKQAETPRLTGLLIEHWQGTSLNTDQGPDLGVAIDLYKERASTVNELGEYLQVFYQDTVTYSEKALKKNWKPNSQELLAAVYQQLETLEIWDLDSISAVIKAVVSGNEVGYAKVAQPIRIAVLGDTNSPSIDAVLALAGRELALKRIATALEQLN